MAIYMHPIYTQIVGSGGAASVTFNNIPQSYRDLRLIYNTKDTRGLTMSDVQLRLNGDNATNYSVTYLLQRGDTGSSQVENRINQAGNVWLGAGAGALGDQTNMFGGNETHFLDYRGNHFKNYYTYGGAISQSQSWSWASYGLWRSTAAITSITLYPLAPNFAQGSSFTLYGLQDNLYL